MKMKYYHEMPMEITFNRNSCPLPSSPIDATIPRGLPGEDTEKRETALAEEAIWSEKNLKVITNVSVGDALMSVVTGIRNPHQLKVVVKYLSHYLKYSPSYHEGCYITHPSLTIALESLLHLQGQLMKDIENSGGAEVIIKSALDSMFPDPDTKPVNKPLGQWYPLPESMVGTLDLLNQVQGIVISLEGLIKDLEKSDGIYP